MQQKIVIRRKTVLTGLQPAADVLGVSRTQVRRHISGKQPSKRLAEKMREHNIVLEDEQ